MISNTKQNKRYLTVIKIKKRLYYYNYFVNKHMGIISNYKTDHSLLFSLKCFWKKASLLIYDLFKNNQS